MLNTARLLSVIATVAVWLGSFSLRSQSANSSIAGAISDSQGSVIVGAEVVAKQGSTNLTYKASSNPEGVYVLPIVPVGVYELTVSKTGFKTFQRDGVLLEVAERLRVDARLEVGQVVETVTVKSEVSG